MFDIVAAAFVRKKGLRSGNCVLPDGSSNDKGVITCGGRADVRIAVDGTLSDE
jgi:hypothetical protein